MIGLQNKHGGTFLCDLVPFDIQIEKFVSMMFIDSILQKKRQYEFRRRENIDEFLH